MAELEKGNSVIVDNEEGKATPDVVDEKETRSTRLIMMGILLGAELLRYLADAHLLVRTVYASPFPGYDDWPGIVSYTRQTLLANVLQGSLVTGVSGLLLWYNGFERLHQRLLLKTGADARPNPSWWGLTPEKVGAFYLYLLVVLYGLIKLPFEYWKMKIKVNFGFFTYPSDNTLSEWLKGKLVESGIPTPSTFFLVTIIVILILCVVAVCLYYLKNKYIPLVVFALVSCLFLSTSSTVIDFSIEALRKQGEPFPVSRAVVTSGFPSRNANRILFEQPRASLPGLQQSLQPGSSLRSSPDEEYKTNDKHSVSYILKKMSQNSSSDGQGWTLSTVCFADALNISEETRRILCGAVEQHTYLAKSSAVPAQTVGAWKNVTSPAVDTSTARSTPRDFGKLKEELQLMAKDVGVEVGNINLHLQSHEYQVQNAAATGLNGNAVIMLWDTLFLGRPAAGILDDASPGAPAGAAPDAESPAAGAGKEAERIFQSDDDAEPTQLFKGGLRSLSDSEITGVMAHELGHVKFAHVNPTWLFAQNFLTVCTPIFFYGVAGLSPLAGAMGSAPAVMVATYHRVLHPLVSLSTTVIKNGVGMLHEDEADRLAAAIGSTDAYGRNLISALVKLHENNNVFPDAPVSWQILHDEHPPVAYRVRSIAKAIEDEKKVKGASSFVEDEKTRYQKIREDSNHKSKETFEKDDHFDSIRKGKASLLHEQEAHEATTQREVRETQGKEKKNPHGFALSAVHSATRGGGTASLEPVRPHIVREH